MYVSDREVPVDRAGQLDAGGWRRVAVHPGRQVEADVGDAGGEGIGDDDTVRGGRPVVVSP